MTDEGIVLRPGMTVDNVEKARRSLAEISKKYEAGK